MQSLSVLLFFAMRARKMPEYNDVELICAFLSSMMKDVDLPGYIINGLVENFGQNYNDIIYLITHLKQADKIQFINTITISQLINKIGIGDVVELSPHLSNEQNEKLIDVMLERPNIEQVGRLLSVMISNPNTAPQLLAKVCKSFAKDHDSFFYLIGHINKDEQKLQIIHLLPISTLSHYFIQSDAVLVRDAISESVGKCAVMDESPFIKKCNLLGLLMLYVDDRGKGEKYNYSPMMFSAAKEFIQGTPAEDWLGASKEEKIVGANALIQALLTNKSIEQVAAEYPKAFGKGLLSDIYQQLNELEQLNAGLRK